MSNKCGHNNIHEDHFAGALLPFLAGVLVTIPFFYLRRRPYPMYPPNQYNPYAQPYQPNPYAPIQQAYPYPY